MGTANDRPDPLPQPALLKSRGALELLEAVAWPRPWCATWKPRRRAAELRSLLGKLGIAPRELLRTGEDEHRRSAWPTAA